MTVVAEYRVPGEDIGWAVPAGLAVAGCAFGWAALALWTAPSAEPLALASKPAAPVVVERVVEKIVERAAAETPLASGTPACPPLVVAFSLADYSAPSAVGAAARTLATFATANPEATFLVDGHADVTGDDGANLDLSRRRARAVAAALEGAGVARPRLTVRGLGAYVPVEGQPEDAAANRRVVVTIRNTHACPFKLEEDVRP